MNKTEQQLADELDSLITRKLKQRPAEPADDVAVLANLADQLVGLAQATEAEADFVAALEAQLTRSASRRPTPKVKQPEGLSFGQFVKEFLTMKRPIFALGTVAVLAVVAYFAWTMFQTSAPGSAEPVAVAGVTPTTAVNEPTIPAENGTEETAVPTSDPATLIKLPGISGAAGVSMGMGGGGGAAATSDIAIDPMPVDGEFPVWNPLGETNFVLNTTLPQGETAVAVYNQPGNKLLTLDDAVRLAGLFGLPTTLYQDQYQPYTDENGTVWTPPPVYQTFDGLRNLAVREDGWYYYDQSAAPNYNYEPMPVEQAKPIAEAFLRDRGLLNFTYEIVAPYGADLEFHRILDGRRVNYPEYMVSVNSNGQVLSVANNPLTNLSAIGNYPVQSAQTAWDILTSGEIDYTRVSFFTSPGSNYVLPTPVPLPEAVDDGLYKSWQNLPQNGDTVTIFPYPGVMTAVNGDAPPRINVDQYRLIASDADLQAIVPYTGQQIRMVGTINDMETTPTLTLQSWEPVVANTYEFVGLEGSISRSGDSVTFNSSDGQSFVLPNPPADLLDGERVYFYGWQGLNENGETVIQGWQGLDRIVEAPPVTIDEPVIDGPYVEYTIGQATINEVSLIYIFSPVYDPETAETQFYLQPAWNFRGETDTNEIINLFVQAVDPTLVQAPTP